MEPKCLSSAASRMSLTSVLLPEPETPVTHVSVPSGMRAVTFCKLFSRAPVISSQPALPTGEMRLRGSDNDRDVDFFRKRPVIQGEMIFIDPKFARGIELLRIEIRDEEFNRQRI